jgi:uncharacterized pyridoxamine 5'-phosphate oxidase family protein
MITADQKKLIEGNSIALATVNGEKPHVIAVASVKVVEDKIIITDNYMKTTKDNIANNSNVSLAVWNNEWGLRVSGKAEYFSSGKWHDFVKALKENKGEPCKGAIVVTPSEIKELG